MSSAGHLSFTESFVLSGIAAVVSKTASAPLERVKLLIQNQNEMLKQGVINEKYNGIIDCTKRVVTTEGFWSLWRGNVANCIRYFPTQGLNFAFKDTINSLIAVSPQASAPVRLMSTIVAGGLAGAISLLVVYPLDYGRTRLANDAAEKKGATYTGLLDVWKKTIRSEGITGMYRGFAISVFGIMFYRGLFFGLYDFLKPIILDDDPHLLELFLLGYATTVASEVISYPTDTIRRRMMMTAVTGKKYKSALDCAVKIVRNEGAKSLMKGVGANVLRGIAGAMVLAGFDHLQKYYLRWRDSRGGGGGGGAGVGSGSKTSLLENLRENTGTSLWGVQGTNRIADKRER